MLLVSNFLKHEILIFIYIDAGIKKTFRHPIKLFNLHSIENYFADALRIEYILTGPDTVQIDAFGHKTVAGIFVCLAALMNHKSIEITFS